MDARLVEDLQALRVAPDEVLVIRVPDGWEGDPADLVDELDLLGLADRSMVLVGPVELAKVKRGPLPVRVHAAAGSTDIGECAVAAPHAGHAWFDSRTPDVVQRESRLMDDRVYDLVVCAACGTQLHPDADGNYDPCGECSGLKDRVLRVRVTRDSVIEQIKPRQHLIEKSVYFGCVGQSGHYYFDAKLRHLNERDGVTPWGASIDGGLFPRNSWPPQGEAHVFHREGWTAIAFADSSVDRRPGSWSVFCVPATLDGPEALNVARAAFPTIFARYPFKVELAT